MPRKQLRFGRGFKVAMSNKRAQAATMVIARGDCEGGTDNKHRGADQWLFVLSGSGVATLGVRTRRIKAGTRVLIERGTTHEIRNTGRTPLKTLNLYVPPAYAMTLPRMTSTDHTRDAARCATCGVSVATGRGRSLAIVGITCTLGVCSGACTECMTFLT